MPSRLGTCTLEIFLCAVNNLLPFVSDRLFISAMTSCEFCGFLFHNRFQVGPHKRVCRKRQHVSKFFPEAQEAEEWDTTAAFSADEGGETEEKLLRSLAMRPVAPWGLEEEASTTAARPRNTFDARCTVDYTPVRQLACLKNSD